MTKPAASDTPTLSLAAEFPAADPDTWMALVEKSLGGRPYDKLTTKSYDGLDIKPLYTAAASSAAPRLKHSISDLTQTGWDIRCLSAHPDPVEANRQILSDLQKGATSITLKLDPTGRSGTIVKSRADLELLLEGVFLDLARVVLDPGGPSLPPAAYLMDVLARNNIAAESFTGNFGADPLSTLAAVGKVIVPIETLLGRMADLAAHTAKTYPSARSLNIATAVYHSAGCSEAQELAIAMATAVDYLRHITQAGVSIDDACKQVAFTLTCDTDVFLTIAKFRAARRLWTRVAEVCRGTGASLNAPLYALTAPRMMSRRDPWVNMLRGTAACFAAGAGGADAITVLPFEHAVGLPTSLGRRIARNSQIVLQEESSLSRVADPAGGSWLVESLTHELAEKAWALFRDIESSGGLTENLVSGRLAEKIAETEVARARNIATRKDALTGISEFPNIAETPVTVDTPDVESILNAAEERAAVATGEAGELPKYGDGVLMEALVKAASGDASAATIGAALKGTPTEITPLPQHRLAEDYEHLRDASDAHKEAHGKRPQVFLANIGKVADFTARASFATNLFEAGGVEALPGPGGLEPAVIEKDFAASTAKAAVICSTDALYENTVADVAKRLKAAGAQAVYLAGRGGDHEAAWREAGVDDFVFMGCDVLTVLNETHQRLGVSA
ncbi:MAG: methylmalonyl-CoA mutase family protein [Rhodospirillaceae bacterium]